MRNYNLSFFGHQEKNKRLPHILRQTWKTYGHHVDHCFTSIISFLQLCLIIFPYLPNVLKYYSLHPFDFAFLIIKPLYNNYTAVILRSKYHRKFHVCAYQNIFLGIIFHTCMISFKSNLISDNMLARLLNVPKKL